MSLSPPGVDEELLHATVKATAIAINTSQDVVLALLGCAVVGGVIYLIIKKSSDVGEGVGQRLVGLTGAADAKEPQDCYEG